METKKSRRQDVFGKVRLFRSIGFTIALGLVITAFEWRTPKDPMIDLQEWELQRMEDLIEIPVTKLEPPKPMERPVTFVPTREEDPDPVDVPSIDLEGELPTEVVPAIPAVEPETEDELPFVIVEDPATPRNGLPGFYAYVSGQLKGKYPAVARRMGIEGRVFVEFIVERDGHLSAVRVVKGIGGGCDELAARIVQSAPDWNPARQRGKAVRQKLTIPIHFRLN